MHFKASLKEWWRLFLGWECDSDNSLAFDKSIDFESLGLNRLVSPWLGLATTFSLEVVDSVDARESGFGTSPSVKDLDNCLT